MDVTEQTLAYAIGECALGLFLVAESDRGIAAIFLGDRRERLLDELTAEFGDTMFAETPDAMVGTLADVAAFLDAPERGWDRPLDLQGSALERAVWMALQAVPAGRTTSYGAIAKALPVPATAQEVGAACGANRIAVAIPCHRVVKADGSISGYRWGVWRKRKLLAREAA